MIYKYIKKHFNVILFIIITLISMIISFNSKNLDLVFGILEMIYILIYFSLEQYTGKIYDNDILCLLGIALGVLIVYFFRTIGLPNNIKILLHNLYLFEVGSIPFFILLAILFFIVKPIYDKTKNKTFFNITFTILLILYIVLSIKFYFYIIS